MPRGECLLCKKPEVTLFPSFGALNRITSDNKPWPDGGQLGVCHSCGFVQKVVDDKWLSEADDAYDAYTMYDQGQGQEQKFFDEASGKGASRSSFLLNAFQDQFVLPEQGRWLDIGCGNGALLRTCSHLLPEWTFSGLELDDKNKEVIETIDRFEALHTSPVDQLPGPYDVISIIYVLEHIIDPVVYVRQMMDKLSPTGLLLIMVPDFIRNPFDLLVVDHCSHFTNDTLKTLINLAGDDLNAVPTDWAPKELTMVVQKSDNTNPAGTNNFDIDLPEAYIKWLNTMISDARNLAQKPGKFGLFGTALSSSWLWNELDGRVDFFVDEDPHRVGNKHMGLPIYHPSEVPEDSDVYLSISPAVSDKIRSRELTFPFNCHFPRPLPTSLSAR